MQLLVMAKEPRPGRAKTRLCPPCTPAQAAAIAEACLADSLATVAATPARRRVLALEGRCGPWLPDGVEVVEQATGGLGARLDAALRACFDAGPGPVVVIGMDTPQATPAQLVGAGRAVVGGADAVLGPAADGGWWLLGLARYQPGLFDGVPMSTDGTGAAQLRRLRAALGRVVVTRTLRDLDHAADATALAAALPGSRLAAAVARAGLSGPGA